MRKVSGVPLGCVCLALLLGCPTAPFSISGSVGFNGAGLSGVTVSAGSTSAATDAGGSYTIALSSGGTYTVSPNKADYAFSPPSQQVTLTSAVPAATGISFTASQIPIVQFSLQASWSSPTPSDSLSFVTTSPARAVFQAANTRRFSTVSAQAAADRIIIRYKDGVVKSQSLTDRLVGYGTIVQSVANPRMMFDAMKVDIRAGRTVDEVLAYCQSLPEVAYAEIDGIVHTLGTPNDTDFSSQWNFSLLNMPTVWNTVTGNSAVVVAVVDTGLYRSLPDFAGARTNPVHVQSGYNAITQKTDTSTTSDPTASSDDNGHGTHVSGTIAEATNDSFEAAGMAYGVTLLPVKVLDQTGSGSESDVAAGIEWAIQQTPKPDVINLSLGSSQPSATLHAALQDAFNAGVAIFAAAGNEGSNQVDYPAAYQDVVVSVGAIGVNKELAYYSNFGPQLDVVAPGGDDSAFPSSSPQYFEDWIWQETIAGYNQTTGKTDYTEGVFGYEGTSMATPHVSALAALLKSQNASLTPAQIYSRIESTADDLGTPGRDTTFGYGLIDPAAALGTTIPAYGQNQAVTGSIQAGATPPSYTFHASANSAVTFQASMTSGTGNLVLKLYDPSGSLLSTSPTSKTPVLSTNLGAAGTYRIEVDSAP